MIMRENIDFLLSSLRPFFLFTLPIISGLPPFSRDLVEQKKEERKKNEERRDEEKDEEEEGVEK